MHHSIWRWAAPILFSIGNFAGCTEDFEEERMRQTPFEEFFHKINTFIISILFYHLIE